MHTGGKIQPLTNGVGRTVFPLVQEQLDTCLSHHTKINSQWNKDLNVRHKTLKILERLYDTGMGMGFLQNEHSSTRNNQQIIKWQRKFDTCMHMHAHIYSRIFCRCKEDVKLWHFIGKWTELEIIILSVIRQTQINMVFSLLYAELDLKLYICV